MKVLSSGACHNLDEQGFTNLGVEEKSRLNIALRITPMGCIAILLVGFYYQSWEVFALLTVFGLLGAFTKTKQPIDFFYNKVLSGVLTWPKLPPSPAPKQFACLIGAVFLIGATAAFYFEWTVAGYIFGILYIFAAGLMAATHFCIGSWMYRHILGK